MRPRAKPDNGLERDGRFDVAAHAAAAVGESLASSSQQGAQREQRQRRRLGNWAEAVGQERQRVVVHDGAAHLEFEEGV